MEIRLLGPVEVWNTRDRINLPRPHRRCVLAALAMTPGQLVPTETLIERVWDDRPPSAVRHSLYTHVSAIRRLLAATNVDGQIILRSSSGGYTLEVDPQRVDLHRARRYAAYANGLSGRGSAADRRALKFLRHAGRLWRGSPLGGLRGDWAARVRSTLDQERLALVVERFTLEVRLGEHDSAIGPLSTLLAENPLVEPLAGLQMLALYRSGRPAEALEAYARIRRRLADELGAEPSTRLQQLQVRILRRDPGLDVAPDRITVAEATATPAQLPLAAHGFTGRMREVAWLDEQSANGASLVAIFGTAGIGKTALALYWTHRTAHRFADGQLYANLRGFDPGGTPMDPSVAVRGFLDALQVQPQRIPTTLEAQTGLYRSLLTGRRMLILLDNALDAEQVRPLLPGVASCLVVVTSRHQMPSLIAAEGARPLTLDLLPRPDAKQLLAQRLGDERVVAEPEAIDEIVTRCARLPLALALVAARAATHPGFPLAALSQDPIADVQTVFSWSYRTLSPAAAMLFHLLGLHPGPDTAAPAAASLAGITPARANAVLAELAGAHMLTEHRPGRYTFHDLLRAYAIELAQSANTETDRRQAWHRVLDHYLHTAHAAATLLHPHRDPITLAPARNGVTCEGLADHSAALDWFTAQHPVLLAVIDRAEHTGFDTHAWQLAWTLRTFFERRGHWHDMAATHKIALRAAQRAADPVGQAHSYRGLAGAHLRLNQLDDARAQLQSALDLFERLGDQVAQARMHLSIGFVAGRQDKNTEALRHAQLALDLFLAAGDTDGRAGAVNDIGWYHNQLGNHAEAVTFCEQALALHQEAGNPLAAHAWDSLGYAHHRLGRHRKAGDCFEQALALFRKLGDRYYEADTLTHLGDAHHDAGRLDAARAAWQRALDILTELGHADAEPVRAKLEKLSVTGPTTSNA